jgi:hypothetical protein
MESDPNESITDVTDVTDVGDDGDITDVIEVDVNVLRDLESKYATVACPVHNSPPSFDVAPDGSVVERMCCEVLLRIFRELQAKEAQESE